MSRCLHRGATTGTLDHSCILYRRYTFSFRACMPLVVDKFGVRYLRSCVQFSVESAEQFKVNAIPSFVGPPLARLCVLSEMVSINMEPKCRFHLANDAYSINRDRYFALIRVNGPCAPLIADNFVGSDTTLSVNLLWCSAWSRYFDPCSCSDGPLPRPV